MADQTKAKELKSRWQMLSLIPIPQWIKFSFFLDGQDAQGYGITDCGVFKRRGIKLERFLHKNQHNQMQLLEMSSSPS